MKKEISNPGSKNKEYRQKAPIPRNVQKIRGKIAQRRKIRGIVSEFWQQKS